MREWRFFTKFAIVNDDNVSKRTPSRVMDNKNFCIILAGGIGSKLWPLSRTVKPKQFLDLFGIGRTMLQMTYDRFIRLIPKENIYISTFRDYVPLVKEQLPDVDDEHIVREPLQISTAPAVALSLIHILKRTPQANVISAPADQLIFDLGGFEQQIGAGLKFIDGTDKILAIGIKPTRPATSYGYLQADVKGDGDFLRLKSYTEKPNYDFAKVFMDSGEFYWNTGIFLWNSQTMLQIMGKEYPDIAGAARLVTTVIDINDTDRIVTERYPRIRLQSVDTLILEHHTNVFIAPCTFGWADVGSWRNFYDLQQKDADGNVCGESRHLFYSCKNNILNIANDKVVILQDLEDYMVVENDNVLLVCRKGDPSLVRRILNDAQMKFGEEIK